VKSGAGTRPHTLIACRDFVRENESGIIFLEELDKALPVRNTEPLRSGIKERLLLDERFE
jgi:hypothetical protein